MINRLRRRFLRRNPRVRLLASTLLLVLVASLCAASVAMAQPGDKVIADWRADNHIDKTYSLAELDAAKERIGNSQLEYTSFGKELERVRAKALIDASGGKDAAGVGNGGPNKAAVLVVGVLILLVLAGTGWYYLRAGGSSGARARGEELDREREAAAAPTPEDGVDTPTTIITPDSVVDAPTEVIRPDDDPADDAR